jgi:predicted NBD/HSP70 family sugar kinase
MVKERSKIQGADHSVMRELNRSVVLDVLKHHSPISRAAIAKAADLAKPTVSTIVDELLRDGLAHEIGMGEGTAGGGRPPILLEFNRRSQFFVGVWVGVRQTMVSVADARGGELSRVERPTPAGTPKKALEQVAAWIKQELASAGAKPNRLAAIGVCVPGLVDIDSGTVLLAPNLGWTDVALRDELHARLKVPVFVHNVAQAVAVAEAVEGAAKDATEVVTLYEDVGVGAGILTNGRLLHGAGGFPGEIGHCTVPGATGWCNCGKQGCLETIASAAAIHEAYRKQTRRRRPLASDGSLHLGLLRDADDPVANAVLGEAGRAVGVAASWLVNLFNPEVLVVAGGFLDAGDVLYEALEAATLECALPQAAARVSVRRSALGTNAPVRGAVLLALQASETYYRVIFQG